VNLQAELDRAFGAAVAVAGDVITWQHGIDSYPVSAFVDSGDEPEATSNGATVTVLINLADFPGMTPMDLTGDVVIVGSVAYSAYRPEAFGDNTVKFWLKRRP
jgi:hypothetical protein